MKFDELEFDNSGQSQQLTGIMRATKEGAAPTERQEYPLWVRRSKRATLDNDYAEEWVYWLIGEDGVILSAGVTEKAARIVVELRTANDKEYAQLTNHGAF